MDSWPADDRNIHPAIVKTKGQSKNQEKTSLCNYPDIEQGSNVLNLSQKDDHLEWTSIVKTSSLGQLRKGKSATIFPPTRPLQLHATASTILQSAEQGANFLRTYLPDVDIPAELIRDEISRDARIMRKLNQFDPQVGNILDVVILRAASASKQCYLAFPMGEVNRDLNLSPFSPSDVGMVFKPSAYPIKKFETPIRQISTPNVSFPDGVQNTCIAIRTFGFTSLLEVKAGATYRVAPTLSELATIQHVDTNNRALVDIKISTSPFEALGVTDVGALYRCSVLNGKKSMNLIHSPHEDAAGNIPDSFWRVAQGVNNAQCLLASSNVLTQVDLRTNTTLDLFSIPRERDVFTSVEDKREDNIITLCSTREILWIDRRYPGKPLLGYRHGRQYDRSLEARTIPLPPASTLLTSRNNGMVTVYDVFRSGNHPIHLDGPSYCMFSDKAAGAPHLGQIFLSDPFDTSIDGFSLIRLSDRGSLHQLDIHAPDSNCASVLETSWSTDIKQLSERHLRPNAVAFEKQDFTETNLFPAYDDIFRVHRLEKEIADEENKEALYDLLEKIPNFWQETDAPIEHMVTMYDAVFRAGDDPIEELRTDFLTGSIINSTRGYRAMVQGRLSAHVLLKGASWHYDIAPILHHFDPDFRNDIQNHEEALRRYNLAEDPERSAQSLRRETEAREQLALDLSLSTNVFSSQIFSKFSDDDLQLETMTKTLSLADEPPPLEFGYFRPVPAVDHYDKTDIEKIEVVASVGVRTLLKGWEVGTDPEDFIFADHYDGNFTAQPLRQPKKSSQDGGNASQPPTVLSSQRPPIIVAAAVAPSNPTKGGNKVLTTQSQGLPTRTVAFGNQPSQSSQEYMTSTQVLPGVYGGRPSVGKKRVVKKRIGGF